MSKTEDKGHAEELRKWRESHFDELEKTLTTLRGIRDSETLVPVKCPKCKALIEIAIVSAKDRIEASKGIARMLSAMVPEKVAATAEEKDSAMVSARKKPELSPALKAKLASVLNHAPS